jgi:hypothetical protein
MKTLLLTVIMGIALWLSPSLYADSITEGKLVFDCSLCITSPSHGSFSFDNTTSQFESFHVNWNDISFGFSGLLDGIPNGTQQGIFDSLLIGTLGFVFNCTWFGDGNPKCDDQLQAWFGDASGDFMPLGPIGDPGLEKVETASDFALGTVGVRNLHDPVSTPEPSALTLAFMGLLASLAALIYRKQERLL